VIIITLLFIVIVAIGLLLFGYIILSQSTFTEQLNIANFNLTHWGTLVISIIFIARTIGDFNIVGLFKKQKTGEFAQMDSKVYVPLCLFISLSCLCVFLL